MFTQSGSSGSVLNVNVDMETLHTIDVNGRGRTSVNRPKASWHVFWHVLADQRIISSSLADFHLIIIVAFRSSLPRYGN
ncbi:hypothetical protein M407DRAFT_26258 [Tulasnella calospora MUT 4182]|uniref:Uncharacterized protein n=1 Tax=Tulasnella calospora MUT 4182 TaxID=1051891 RepID=A0A0C3QEM6_9AGAM|nr:hypothetical protein M407DRAFT_26258 [Tulasnella calospora MUT 4182]